MKNIKYPDYLTFESLNKQPTFTKLHFEEEVSIEPNKVFYPKNENLEPYFKSNFQSQKFGAAQFIGFLHDTITVEHNIVIPAIRDLHLLPIHIPNNPREELFKLVTDEGHHAAQALSFINQINKLFNIETHENGEETPKFLRNLFEKRKTMFQNIDDSLFNMIIGVVTETRISKELGLFTNDKYMNSAVVRNCASHQEDETIHASQFRALGQWTWEQFDDRQRRIVAEVYAETAIARSLPDVARIGFYFSQASGISKKESLKIVSEIYTDDVVMNEMLLAAKPTIAFLKNLGVLEYSSASSVFEQAGIKI